MGQDSDRDSNRVEQFQFQLRSLHYQNKILKKKLPKKNLYIGDDLETFIELYNIGMKLKEVSLIFTNIPCRTIA